MRRCGLIVALVIAPCLPSQAADETALSFREDLPDYLKDRGDGLPLSMFGSYIEKGRLIVYPFYEYYHDRNAEYAPNEFGHTLDQDFRGDYTAHEGLIFFGYGVSDRLALEFEAAVIAAELEKAGDDPSTMPQTFKESGLGDVEGQVRYRLAAEDADRPEVFSYFETVFPLQRDKKLIGTQAWEFKLGFGAVKGFGFGTLTARAAVEYDRGERKTELGEMAVEYLRKLSPRWRVFCGMEGTPDEVEAIAEIQWHYSRRSYVKVNGAFGVTSKATDLAPEIGIVFLF